MLVVLSPAKRLDWSPAEASRSVPAFQADAARLARVAGRLSQAELRKLMAISADLARLNQGRFRAFAEDPAPEATRPALRAFAGDTYQGFDAASVDPDALNYAQRHLRILSGLYGVLRPFDAIQPYRLEMGTRLRTRRGADLYAFWGARIAQVLDAEATATGSGALVNCASLEYFGAVDRAALGVPVVSPLFLEERGGQTKVISFSAKRARGAMARFVMEHRLRDPAGLADFDLGGYRFAPERSTDLQPVFIRPEAAQSAA